MIASAVAHQSLLVTGRACCRGSDLQLVEGLTTATQSDCTMPIEQCYRSRGERVGRVSRRQQNNGLLVTVFGQRVKTKLHKYAVQVGYLTIYDVKEHITQVALNFRPSARTLAMGFGNFVPASSIPSDARFGRAGRRLCASIRESASGNLQFANHIDFTLIGCSLVALHKPGMSQRLGLIALPVHDYDQASASYVGELGFEQLEDEALLPTKCWFVVAPSDGASGTVNRSVCRCSTRRSNRQPRRRSVFSLPRSRRLRR